MSKMLCSAESSSTSDSAWDSCAMSMISREAVISRRT